MTITSYEVIDFLGIFDTYLAGCNLQPIYDTLLFLQYPTPIDRVSPNALSSSYNQCPINPLLPSDTLFDNVFTEEEEVTMLGVYVISDGFDYSGGSHAFIPYVGNAEKRTSTPSAPYSGTQFRSEFPGLVTQPSGNCFGYYQFKIIYQYVSKRRYYRRNTIYPWGTSGNNTALLPRKPIYIDLLKGFNLDLRIIPDFPEILPLQNKKITIQYYRENDLEPIPNLRSIDWLTYTCILTKDVPIKLPIEKCVLGTLYCDDASVLSQISNLSSLANFYDWSDLLPQSLPNLFAYWTTLYNIASISPPIPAVAINIETSTEIGRMLRTIGADNNHWNNQPNPVPDLNFDPSHPMFLIDNNRAYEWHVEPQGIDLITGLDKGNGRLLMDSIRTKEIHAALGAGTYGINPDDPTIARIDNLGWRIQRENEILGIRVKTDGTIDEVLEKTENRRLHVEGSDQNDVQDYNPNCFGKKGMLVRHLPNRFSPKGTIAGGYRKIKDIPQLLAEFHEQANGAMGYQEGTAIEIQLDGEIYRYPNQLALLTELLITAKQSAIYSKGAFFSSLIGEQSIKEVIAGLGLRTVDKYLEFKVAGKMVKLYYKGISASQSVRRKLSAVATNVGIAIGNII